MQNVKRAIINIWHSRVAQQKCAWPDLESGIEPLFTVNRVLMSIESNGQLPLLEWGSQAA